MRYWKVQPVIALGGLRGDRVAVGIVDELVVSIVMQAVGLRRRVDGETAEPIRNDLVEISVFEQREVCAFVNDCAELDSQDTSIS